MKQRDGREAQQVVGVPCDGLEEFKIQRQRNKSQIPFASRHDKHLAAVKEGKLGARPLMSGSNHHDIEESFFKVMDETSTQVGFQPYQP